MQRQRGFTLVEVLVAVVIVSLAAVAATRQLGQSTRQLSWLNEKTQAYQVAADKLVELQVYQQWPSTGVQDSRTEQFGARWSVRTTVKSGPFPDTRRVDIAVTRRSDEEDAAPAYILSSLVGKPGESGT